MKDSVKKFFDEISAPMKTILLFSTIFESYIVAAGNFSNSVAKEEFLVVSIYFPIGVFIYFATILYNKPANLYAPNDYSETSVKEFVGALHSHPVRTIGDTDELLIDDFVETSLELFERKNNSNAQIKVTGLEENDEAQNKFVKLIEEGNYLEAISIVNEKIEDTTDDFPKVIPWINKKALALINIDVSEAQMFIKEVLTEHPQELQFYLYFSQLLSEIKMYNASLIILNNGLDVITDKHDINYLLIDKALVYKSLNDIVNQKLICEKIIDMDIAGGYVSIAYKILGDIEYESDNIEEATNYNLKAYRRNPNSEHNLIVIANFFLQIEDYDNELYFRKKISEKFPSFANFNLLGNSYIKHELSNLAYSAYKEAEKIEPPPSVWALNNLGNLYNNIGLYTEANQLLEKSLTIHPANEYALNRISQTLENINKEHFKENEILDNFSQLGSDDK